MAHCVYSRNRIQTNTPKYCFLSYWQWKVVLHYSHKYSMQQLISTKAAFHCSDTDFRIFRNLFRTNTKFQDFKGPRKIKCYIWEDYSQADSNPVSISQTNSSYDRQNGRRAGEWNAGLTDNILRNDVERYAATRRPPPTSALPDSGVQVGKILMLHCVVRSHPPLWITHQQTLQPTNQPTNQSISRILESLVVLH